MLRLWGIDDLQRHPVAVIDRGDVLQEVVALLGVVTEPAQDLFDARTVHVHHVLVTGDDLVAPHRVPETLSQGGDGRVGREVLRRRRHPRPLFGRRRGTAVQRVQPLPELVLVAHGCLSFGRTTAPVEIRPLDRFWFVEFPKGAVIRSIVSAPKVGSPSTRSSSARQSCVGEERRIFSWSIRIP